MEALIAGWGLAEALKRAEAYHTAGADAILIHSRQSSPAEIFAFLAAWGQRSPVVLVPTTYWRTSTQAFRARMVSVVIWANHLLRSSIGAMKETAERVHDDESLLAIEPHVAPLQEIFRLQGDAELAEAERRYLPARDSNVDRHCRSSRKRGRDALPSVDSRTGVVIAAGRGARMGELIAARPKCLLPFAGRVLLDYTLANLRAARCRRIVIVTGYRHSDIEAHVIGQDDVVCVRNGSPSETNVLHSLMCARPFLNGATIITYSDTVVASRVMESIVSTPGRIVVGADVSWRSRYENRVEHPVSEAEKVRIDGEHNAVDFGKHLPESSPSAHQIAEFIGVVCTTSEGSRILVDAFSAADARLGPSDPFHAAARWQNAYLTDLLKECVDRGERVDVAPVSRGWVEIDTPEDYSQLPALAKSQDLGFAIGDD